MPDPVSLPEVGLRIEEHRLGGTLVLAVEGEADLHVAPTLQEQLTKAIDGGARYVVLDLSGVTFVDSTALGVVVGGMKHLRSRGGELRLVVPQTDVRRVFAITLLDQVLTIDATRTDALAAFDVSRGRA